MKRIEIKDSDLNLNSRARFAREVIETGHLPGVLSGANLQGRAKQYGKSYAVQRDRAAVVVRNATKGRVQDSYYLINSRWARVWVDMDANEPVEIDIVPDKLED